MWSEVNRVGDDMSKSTTFISYRREGGADLARYLHDKLTEMGVDAFIDVDDLSIGKFKREIEQQIIKRQFFIVVLTPTTLESEWVRLEIKTALAHGKDIIPFVTREFDFYVDIPDDVKQLGDFNAIEYDFRYPEIAFEKLRFGILHKSDTVGRRPQTHDFAKRPPNRTKQQRNLQAAMPACSQFGVETEVRIKIVLPDSQGLRAELPDILPSGDVIQQSDVRDNTFQVKLERDEKTGLLQAGNVCLEVTSSDYIVEIPKEQAPCEVGQIMLEIDPEFDTRTVICHLKWNQNNKRTGRSRVMIRLTQAGKIIAETSVSTQIVHSLDEHPTCNMWQLQLAHLTMGQGGLGLGAVATGGASPEPSKRSPATSMPPPPPVVQPAPSTRDERKRRKSDEEFDDIGTDDDDGLSTGALAPTSIEEETVPYGELAQTRFDDFEDNDLLQELEEEVPEEGYSEVEIPAEAKKEEKPTFDLDRLEDNFYEEETVKGETYLPPAEPSPKSEAPAQIDDTGGVLFGGNVSDILQEITDKNDQSEIITEKNKPTIKSATPGRRSQTMYPPPQTSSASMQPERKGAGKNRLAQMVGGIVLIGLVGLIVFGVMNANDGDDNANVQTTQIANAEGIMQTETAEALVALSLTDESEEATNAAMQMTEFTNPTWILDDVTSSPQTLTAVAESSNDDETNTPEPTNTARPTETGTPTPLPTATQIASQAITLHWRRDGLVIHNTSDITLDIDGLTLIDDGNSYEIGMFIPQSILANFRSGRCVAVYADRLSSPPAFVDRVCNNLVGEETTSESNFIWLAEDSFEVMVGGLVSTCETANTNQCIVQVPTND